MNESVWDKNGALQRFNNNQQMLEKVVSKFLGSAPAKIAELKASIQQSEDQNIRLHAHSLKGMAATVGAIQCSVLCEDLEHNFAVMDMERRLQQVYEIESGLRTFVSIAESL